MLKNKRGITLIALVVTIIILLILAGVTINMVLGDGGILNKTKVAAEKYQNAQEQEEYWVGKIENEIKNYEVNSNRDDDSEITTLKNQVKALTDRIEELENINSFSTTEKAIGKYIDGSTLYQITYTGHITPKSGENDSNYLDTTFIIGNIPSDAKKVVDIYYFIFWGNDESSYGGSRPTDSKDLPFVNARKIYVNNKDNNIDNDYILTIKYIK